MLELTREPLKGLHFEILKLKDNPRLRLYFFLKSIVSFPINFIKKLYHTYLIIKYGELREPLAKTICPMKLVNTFSLLPVTLKVIIQPDIMKEMLRYPRKDPNGLFNDHDNMRFCKILFTRLFPEYKNDPNDFLFTCDADKVDAYRHPILQLVGSTNIARHSNVLESCAKEIINSYLTDNPKAKINNNEFCHNFSSLIISKLILGHPGVNCHPI